jgi:hypothetical protein
MSTMEHVFDRIGRLLVFVLIAGVGLLLTACGASVVRGESPFVQINALKLNHETVTVELGVRNVNDVVMEIEKIDFVLTVQATELTRYDAPMLTSVIANGSETLRFEVAINPAGRDLLGALQNAEIASLPYELEGTIQAAEESLLTFHRKGHIYPVPGRPGQFR